MKISLAILPCAARRHVFVVFVADPWMDGCGR